MEISTSSLNQPVNFYNKSTGNNINMAINEDNNIYGQNLFTSEFHVAEAKKLSTKPAKRRKKSKRLNTIDTDYLPDEVSDIPVENEVDNFFVVEEKPNFVTKFKKSMDYLFTSTPIINYFFLKQKTKKIQKTVETLNDISENVDDLLNTAVPYGEEAVLYQNIAKNLTDAANILGKANKEL